MSRAIVAAAMAAALTVPSAGWGADEEPSETSPFGGLTLSYGGGPTVPLFNASKRFPVGGNFNLSAGWRLFGRVVVQAEAVVSIHGVEAEILESGNLSASHYIYGGGLGVQVHVLPRGAPFDLYVVGGPGLYARSVEISTVTGGTIPTLCDETLLVCNAGVAPAAGGTVATGKTLGLGLSGGVGASFSLGLPVRLFVEARFYYLWGSVEAPEGERAAHGQYLPIMVGFRYF